MYFIQLKNNQRLPHCPKITEQWTLNNRFSFPYDHRTAVVNPLTVWQRIVLKQLSNVTIATDTVRSKVYTGVSMPKQNIQILVVTEDLRLSCGLRSDGIRSGGDHAGTANFQRAPHKNIYFMENKFNGYPYCMKKIGYDVRQLLTNVTGLLFEKIKYR